MNELMLRGLQDDLADLKKGARVRKGVVVGVDPLSVTIAGAPQPYTNVASTGSTTFAVGDSVSALMFNGGDMLVLGGVSTTSIAAVGVERFDVQRFGMSGGVTEPASKLQNAIDAAVAVKGEVVFSPLATGGRWKVNGSAQLSTGVSLVGQNGVSNADDKGSVLECTAAAPALIMPNSGLGGYNPVAEVRIEGLQIVSAGDCITVPNGALDVVLRRLLLMPGTAAKGIHHKGFIQDWHIDDVRIEGWHGSIATSASYGWYSDAEPGAGGDGCRMDDCNFDYLYVSGCAISNLHFRVPVSDNVILKMMRSVNCARHGAVLAGGLGSWVLVSPNFEGNGYRGPGAGSITATTGSMTAGSGALTVVSGAGLANGATVCVRRALNGLDDLVTTISSGGGTTSLTLAAPAGYSVSGADVTPALYSDVYAGPDLGSPEALGTTIGGGPQNVTFIGPGWGLQAVDHGLRYAADLSGITAPHVVNAKANARPMYDPQYLAEPWTDDPYGLGVFTPSRDWQSLTALTGWDASAGFAARRHKRRVEIRGYALSNGVGTTANVTVLPPGCRPTRLITRGAAYSAINQIDSGGNVTSSATAVGNLALGDEAGFSID